MTVHGTSRIGSGVKDIEGVDKDISCISEGKSLVDRLGQDIGVLVVNVLIVVVGGASDFKTLVLIKGQGFLIGGLNVKVDLGDSLLFVRRSVFEDVIQELTS